MSAPFHRVGKLAMAKTAIPATPLAGHLPSLDGVRGVAILWVVVHNFSVIDEPLAGPLGHVIGSAVSAGWIGVTLFFALSGFLISGILLDIDLEREPNPLRRFYVRRSLRIFPLYYAVLFAAFVVMPALSPVVGPLPSRLAQDVPHQLWLWSYLANWTAPFDIAASAFPHFWSLAVEEQFYLVWPLLLLRRSAESALRICLVVAGVAVLSRVAMLAAGASPEMLYMFTVSRMDALALGGAAAAALRIPALAVHLEQGAGKAMLFTLGVVLVYLAVLRGIPRTTPLGQTVGYTLMAIAAAALVLALACADRAGQGSWWIQMWRIAPLRVLAKYSYGMYVFHKLIVDAWGKPFMYSQPPGVLRSTLAQLAYFGAGTLATLAAAMLSYHLIEKHLLRLRPSA